MRLRKIRKEQTRGFALILAIFMAVGLETAVAGGMIRLMQHTREIQRLTTGTRLAYSADAVVDRSLRLFIDYITAQNTYPNTDISGKVLGNDSTVTGNPPQDFSTWLAGWFTGTFKPQFASDPQTRLSSITIPVSDIVITETEKGPGTPNKYRRYRIQVTASSVTGGTKKVMAQTVKIELGRLFNFAVFSNEDISLTPGPSLTIQGPFHSNGKINLMTAKDSTLTLKRAKNFLSPGNPEPYVLNSAGNIQFGFPLVVAPNYLLTDSEYQSSVPAEYQAPPAGPALQSREMLPQLEYVNMVSPPPWITPQLYFMSNGIPFAGGAADFKIQAQKADGTYQYLTHVGSEDPCVFDYWYQGFMLVGRYTTCSSTAGFMNYSGAYDPASPPMMDPTWTIQNPLTTLAPVNPRWAAQPVTTVADKTQGVAKKNIPLSTDSPSGAHFLVEPKTDLFPPGTVGTRATVADTPQIAAQKFQSMADLNIYMSQAGVRSPDYQAGLTTDTPRWIVDSEVYDYRIGRLLKVMVINIGNLMTARPNLASKVNGFIIYAHTYPIGQGPGGTANGPHAVKLTNGERIAKDGMTVATPGRLYLQGNYNTYSYEILGCNPVSTNPACFYNKTPENLLAWDNETRQRVPPAAVFSDSTVVLSDQWVDPYGRAGDTGPSALSARGVSADMMVDTAVVTGILGNALVKNYQSCVGNISSCQHFPADDPAFFNCPDGTWVNGISGVSSSCQFYRDPVTKKYYVNRNSLDYLRAVTNGLPNPAAGVQIPIYATDISFQNFNPATGNYQVLNPVRGLPGISYRILEAASLFDQGSATPICTCSSTQQVSCPPPTGPLCPVGQDCIQPGGEQAPSCGGCLDALICIIPAPPPPPNPRINYLSHRDLLYTTKENGGLQNLLGLQENWAGRILRHSGTLTVPWLARELRDPAGNPFYHETTYYAAPTRKFDYDEDLQNRQPPGTPGTLSVKVERIEA